MYFLYFDLHLRVAGALCRMWHPRENRLGREVCRSMGGQGPASINAA